MNRRPLVSILTPSFNQAEWLDKNIRSVRGQTYEPIEHIVMDGGSTDGSERILASAPPSVTWRSEPDRGQSHALNKAFAASNGEIIGWINSDDAYFHPQTISWVVDAFERHPSVDVVYGHVAIVNSEDELLYLKWAPPYSRRIMLIYNFLVQPSVFLRRSAIANETIVDENLHYTMDRALWLRLAEEGRRFLRLNKVLAIDRMRPERKSASIERVWADRRPVDAEYGAPSGGWTSAARWMLHLLSRINGLWLMRQGLNRVTFVERKPPLPELLRRQIARRARNMPA